MGQLPSSSQSRDAPDQRPSILPLPPPPAFHQAPAIAARLQSPTSTLLSFSKRYVPTFLSVHNKPNTVASFHCRHPNKPHPSNIRPPAFDPNRPPLPIASSFGRALLSSNLSSHKTPGTLPKNAVLPPPPDKAMASSETKPIEPEQPTEQQKPEQKPAVLGEDDEFEDFPVDGMGSTLSL